MSEEINNNTSGRVPAPGRGEEASQVEKATQPVAQSPSPCALPEAPGKGEGEKQCWGGALAGKLPVAPDAVVENVAVVSPPPGEPAHHEPPKPRGSFIRRAVGVFKIVSVRTYALVLLLAVAYPGVTAILYLFKTVFIAAPVPKQLLDWQGRIDVAALRQTDVPGMTGPAPRAPIGHYHAIDRWFQPDPTNGCTLVGCHEPLPHTKKMKVPAFANFHTTFLACQMCHSNGQHESAPGWVSTNTGKAQNAPALLELASYLETSEKERKENPAAAHARIVRLLRECIATAGQDEALGDLLVEFDTSEPGSPVWRRAETRLVAELPLHMRGEYGAKLARNAADHAEQSRRLRELASEFQAASVNSPERRKPQETIHASVKKEAATCVSCHSTGGSGMKFEQVGYSPMRAKLLSQLELANLMQRIRDGEHFEIPELLGGENEK